MSSNNDLNAADIRPAVDDAVPVSHKKQRYVQVSTSSTCDAKKQQSSSSSSSPSSLVQRCRAVVVANLERYPPEMFGMLSEDDWDDLIQSKHRKTAPQKGSGGLDGTGRRTPALSERFLAEVEAKNRHLAESTCADELIWKDIVEYQFSRGGLTRPRALVVPWTLLVKQTAEKACVLASWKREEDEAEAKDEQLEYSEQEAKRIIEATCSLQESPMNLALLKESGIGKVLKKITKASSNRKYKSIFKRIKMPVSSPTAAAPASRLATAANSDGAGKELSVLEQLERLLQAWMDLAASKGVEIQGGGSPKKRKAAAVTEKFDKDDDDLRQVEKCKTWRQLFATLKERAEQRRMNLGQKMRNNRKKENAMRPQIVKVRPANPRREAILDRAGASLPGWGRGGGTVASQGGAKILQLRKEASVQSTMQKSGVAFYKKQGSGFGAAVAFAANTKLTSKQKLKQMQDRKRMAPTIVGLGGGKRMKVPQGAIRMQGTTLAPKKPVSKSKPASNPRYRK